MKLGSLLNGQPLTHSASESVHCPIRKRGGGQHRAFYYYLAESTRRLIWWSADNWVTRRRRRPATGDWRCIVGRTKVNLHLHNARNCIHWGFNQCTRDPPLSSTLLTDGYLLLLLLCFGQQFNENIWSPGKSVLYEDKEVLMQIRLIIIEFLSLVLGPENDKLLNWVWPNIWDDNNSLLLYLSSYTASMFCYCFIRIDRHICDQLKSRS